MIHEMKLNNEPFMAIKSGLKKIELRLYDEKRKKIKVNDFIVFKNVSTQDLIKVKVKGIHRFSSFKELYEAFPKDMLGYSNSDESNFDDMLAYYSMEEQKKYGVVGIEIELL